MAQDDAGKDGQGWLDDETPPEAVAEEKRLADELDRLRRRTGTGEVSEAGLRPNDPIRHSPLSGTSSQLVPGFTASLTVRYRRPTPLERDLQLRASLTGKTQQPPTQPHS